MAKRATDVGDMRAPSRMSPVGGGCHWVWIIGVCSTETVGLTRLCNPSARGSQNGGVKAAQRFRYGPPEIVEIREVETPTPTGDQVLVRVRAASVNRADLDGLYPRWQFIRAFYGLRAPRNPKIGLDVAGVVEAIGPDVKGLKVGDEVFGDMFAFGEGAFAEYACAPERAFAPMPAGLSFEEAATLPHSALLALQGLRRRNGTTFKAGDRVLVEGASGNVGPFAVQIAKSMGAHVTGVAHRDKLDLVRSVGADEVIDYTATDYTKAAGSTTGSSRPMHTTPCSPRPAHCGTGAPTPRSAARAGACCPRS